MTTKTTLRVVSLLALTGDLAPSAIAGDDGLLTLRTEPLVARDPLGPLASDEGDSGARFGSPGLLSAPAGLTLQPTGGAAPTPGSQPPAPEPFRNPPFGPDHKGSWELPAVVVEGQPASSLREEDRIGSYNQPRWTATRRFPTTRVYVIPEGKVEVEGWARGTFKRRDQGGETEWRFLQEIEIGLPYRFQLDVYLRQDYATGDDKTLWGGQFEVRWALADWGKIWGNPTLYIEYLTLEDRPDKIEPKLLLGGEIAEGWHWGANAVFEYELSGQREAEYALTTSVSRTIIDQKLSLGIESVFSATDAKGERGRLNTSFVIGPSLQWRPVRNMTVNIAPLIGTTNESPAAQIYFNAGWEF